MKTFTKRLLCIILALSVVFIAALTVFAANGNVSPAIDVIRRNKTLEKCGIIGQSIAFSKSEYQALTGEDLQYITITSLPQNGSLRLNGVSVANGQTVTFASLDYMTFTPSSSSKNAEFTFRCNGEAWENTDLKCRMTFFETRNMPPIISGGEVNTYKNAGCEISLDIFEPDGDGYTVKVDTYPVSGSLRIVNGSLWYIPKQDYTGKDTAVIRAVDKYGNSSRSAVFDIVVTNSKSGIFFEDMITSPFHTQAIALAENGIFTYKKCDGRYSFEPEKPITRLEFAIMLMMAKKVVPNTQNELPFVDAEMLTDVQKSYLSKAVSMGLTEGKAFRPNDKITRGEAALFAAKLCNLPQGNVQINDIMSLSVSKRSAVISCVSAGMFVAENNKFSPNKNLTREETVQILAKIIE